MLYFSEHLESIINGTIYIITSAVVIFLGKIVYDLFHRKFKLKEELVKKDNFALGYAVSGYYFGLFLALGGILAGPHGYWVDGVFDLLYFGIVSIFLFNISSVIQDKIIFSKFCMQKEIIDDENPGSGMIEGGHYIANGLILYGAMSGEGGNLLTALAFWAIGQILLIIAAKIYNAITPFDIHDEIEKDNVAVGIAVAGVLVAFGNIIRLGIEGEFEGWNEHLVQLVVFTIYGFIVLPLVRFFVDHLLLPGEKITDELVNQKRPNLGVAAIEAISYIGASLLIGFAV